ncbi:MAG: hypothetical protein UU40_C0013G0022 [Candidatus Uhrbacteria bacterium GW2011_GWD2_41_121]|uniref:Uncharacterized protein n=1 Tax=Candidatus Uhrbacteria bacterium GW2011_GWC1_41_20 TaxID=1618983 RepID=A0A0G0VCN9_9BACT|nr:MAG: hypothetical protein UT52_C0014G0022 [Candidatus Uhrbacteria bacterium GW2011_GWE1_39_46]KKR63752.1 MAG: hypothetical protein UU04_C0013G0023 [Candidatus Uhrbacteria bacterium GW2011_GWC2_40_450]KKR89877.1 MAG: hypothetical protein UU40_C0013G0022 [Candidatus Uhrbacteria bacterium GW2011_GWD2_41_121]KKR98624.1 MAG: hypothetical protein UU50_C0016G0001 [Candidatus Uhrbacteria bacterium GW2011_GWC1_41_20]KKS05735.1 MAG: hypothetical protein UU60_C0013G0022 [Candidatus Uhrbacteria bacteriu
MWPVLLEQTVELPGSDAEVLGHAPLVFELCPGHDNVVIRGPGPADELGHVHGRVLTDVGSAEEAQELVVGGGDVADENPESFDDHFYGLLVWWWLGLIEQDNMHIFWKNVKPNPSNTQ